MESSKTKAFLAQIVSTGSQLGELSKYKVISRVGERLEVPLLAPIQIYLDELAAIEAREKDLQEDGLINMLKRKAISDVINEYLSYKSNPFHFQSNDWFQKFLAAEVPRIANTQDIPFCDILPTLGTPSLLSTSLPSFPASPAPFYFPFSPFLLPPLLSTSLSPFSCFPHSLFPSPFFPDYLLPSTSSILPFRLHIFPLIAHTHLHSFILSLLRRYDKPPYFLIHVFFPFYFTLFSLHPFIILFLVGRIKDTSLVSPSAFPHSTKHQLLYWMDEN